MPLRLTWIAGAMRGLSGAGLCPERFAGLSPAEAARLTLALGRSQVPVGDLFAVESRPDGTDLTLVGDLSHVHEIGLGMTAGSLHIEGHAGNNLGSAMHGGTIRVSGDVGHDAGAGMHQGCITIHGNAGDGLGGARPGHRLGMRDGAILVLGSAGSDVGERIRRGLIAVAGSLGQAAGRDAIAGTILTLGELGPGAGFGLKRATILAPQARATTLPPGFRLACRYEPVSVRLILATLLRLGFPAPRAAFEAPLARYNGDLLTGGHGEILLPASA